MRHKLAVVAGCCATILMLAAPVRADIIIYTDPSSLQPEENLLFNEDGLIGTGMTVEGITNQTGEVFTITGMEELTTPAAGQARVTSTDDNGFTYALFDARDPNIFYTEFEANLRLFSQSAGSATITATNSAGETESLTFAINQGENFFSVLAYNAQLLDTVLIETTVALMDIRQIRVGGVQEGDDVVPSPEPASLLLFGMAAAGLAGRNRMRRR